MFVVKLLVNAAVLSIVTLYFEQAEHYQISHVTCHLGYNTIIDHSWKLLTMF